jgi:hypothetical protein
VATISSYPFGLKYPSSWGPVAVILLIIGGMALLITGSWRLSDGLNGVVIDYTNPYIHFSESSAAQEMTDGIIYSVLGVACFVTL